MTRRQLFKWICYLIIYSILWFIIGAVVTFSVMRSTLSPTPVVSTRPAVAGDTVEPEATKAWTRALQQNDPVAMRAQVTPECPQDPKQTTCFDQTGDTDWIARHKDGYWHATFLRKFIGHVGIEAVYDIYYQDKVHWFEYTFTFVLTPEGKIDKIYHSINGYGTLHQ